MNTNIDTYSPCSLRTWWIAGRPFSFPASAMPVVFGSVMAASIEGTAFRWGFFVLSLIGMVLLHAASNIINDVIDYRRGLDREILPVSGAVVRRLLSPNQALVGAAIMTAIGILLGVCIASQTTLLILAVGGVGVLVGAGYSLSPIGLKYRALGDVAVFLNFGVLGSLGSWMVQAERFSWLPVLWAVPFSLLVIAILHANNWRDIGGDNAGGFHTVASLLGDSGSYRYYFGLLGGAYALLLVYMLVPRILGRGEPMPLTFFLVFLSLPPAIRLLKRAAHRRSPDEPAHFVALDGATAQFNLIFGALSTVALLLHALRF